MIVIIIWIVLCFVIASIGSKKNIGYWGTFFLSLLLSPLIGLIIALASSDLPQPVKEFKCKHCGFISKVNSHFCPGCDKDDKGLTKEDYKTKTT